MIDSGLVRSTYIGKQLKNLIEEKDDKTISSVASDIGSSQPTLSNALKGKGGSDEYFIRVGKSIGLNDKEIAEIFKSAIREEFKYKFGEDIYKEAGKKEFTNEEAFEIIKEKNNLTDKQIKAVEEYIELQRKSN